MNKPLAASPSLHSTSRDRPATAAGAHAASAGRLLRLARQAGGLPQLELALVLDVSQRHVSFVECGRARPSRELIVEWMRALDAPAELLNAALLRAGFAAQVDEHAAGPPALLLEPLRLLMSASSPIPILLFDGQWTMLGMNAAGEWLAEQVMARYWAKVRRTAAGMRMIDALVDDDGLFLRMANAKEAGASLLAQIQRESWACDALAAPAEALHESLSRRYGVRMAGLPTRAERPRRLIFESRFGALSFDAVLSVLGDPPPAAASGVRIEHWLPADAHTRRVMARQSLAEVEAALAA